MTLLDEGGRCLLTGLLPDQCGCPRHRNSETTNVLADVRLVRFTDAMFPGTCALDETHPVEAGERIGKTQHGWVCNNCVHEIKALRHG